MLRYESYEVPEALRDQEMAENIENTVSELSVHGDDPSSVLLMLNFNAVCPASQTNTYCNPSGHRDTACALACQSHTPVLVVLSHTCMATFGIKTSSVKKNCKNYYSL